MKDLKYQRICELGNSIPPKNEFYLRLGMMLGMLSRESLVEDLIRDGYSREQIETFKEALKVMAAQCYENHPRKDEDETNFT